MIKMWKYKGAVDLLTVALNATAKNTIHMGSLQLLSFSHRYIKQHAQLSQRDRAAGCDIVWAKSRRLELEDNILRRL